MKFTTLFNIAAIFAAALAAPAESVRASSSGSAKVESGGGLPGFSNVIGLFGGEAGFFAFRKAFDVLSEKACDFALNEASRFADFWVFVPAQSELVTAWFEIANGKSWEGISKAEFLEAQKHAKLLATAVSEHSRGTFEGVQPNEFFASNTYLRCRQLYSTEPTDFIETSPEKPKSGKPTKGTKSTIADAVAAVPVPV
ncbi:hypothetical protein TWF281_000589 [Arthrobotrys megalospora]